MSIAAYIPVAISLLFQYCGFALSQQILIYPAVESFSLYNHPYNGLLILLSAEAVELYDANLDPFLLLVAVVVEVMLLLVSVAMVVYR